MHPDRNGYVYVIDRATRRGAVGRRRSCTINYVDRRRPEDRPPQYVDPRRSRKPGKVVRDICPASPGAKDWQPSAFSPRTGLLYIPHQNLCQDVEGLEANYIAGTPYVGAEREDVRRPRRPSRRVHRVGSGRAAQEVWAIKENFPVWSGALATAGDVVFYGTMDGWFKAVDARNGKLLWQFKIGSGIIGQPMTYRGPDGKQYVAVLSGVGGWAGAIVVGRPRPARRTAARRLRQRDDGPAEGTRTKGGTLYVFALP